MRRGAALAVAAGGVVAATAMTMSLGFVLSNPSIAAPVAIAYLDPKWTGANSADNPVATQSCDFQEVAQTHSGVGWHFAGAGNSGISSFTVDFASAGIITVTTTETSSGVVVQSGKGAVVWTPSDDTLVALAGTPDNNAAQATVSSLGNNDMQLSGLCTAVSTSPSPTPSGSATNSASASPTNSSSVSPTSSSSRSPTASSSILPTLSTSMSPSTSPTGSPSVSATATSTGSPSGSPSGSASASSSPTSSTSATPSVLGTKLTRSPNSSPTSPNTNVLGEKFVHRRGSGLPFTGLPIAVMIAVAAVLVVGGMTLNYRVRYRGRYER